MGKPSLNPTRGPSTPGSIVAGLPIEAQKWDYLLNYGPSFNSLVGVCNDIANLPDANKPKVCNNVNKYCLLTCLISRRIFDLHLEHISCYSLLVSTYVLCRGSQILSPGFS